jgi:SAM-dependent methyltransferase
MGELNEITDLISPPDRRPVSRADTVALLRANGQYKAARIVARLPVNGEHLDAGHVDGLMVRIHCELQRLGEELQLGRRVAAHLSPWVRRLLAQSDAPVRIVDVGCGIGGVLRWLACHRVFGDRVELVGVDFDPVLIQYAQRLAAAEHLACRFIVGDAFEPGTAIEDAARTIVISSGVLHHIPDGDLGRFFTAHQVAAFAHWDVDPGPWATLGAWVFHRARMREAVSRHDGVLSARRAHTAETLLRAAASIGYEVSCVDAPRWLPRLTDVLRPISGVWV